MGAWSFNILGDDCSRDVYDDYFKYFNRGEPNSRIVARLLKSFRFELRDSDEGPLVWIGIAKAQWDCGNLQRSTAKRVRRIIEQGLGLSLWQERGHRALQRRREALKKFLRQLETENPKPRTPKPVQLSRAVFERGACLAIRLPDNSFGAAIVLGVTEADPRDPDGSMASNLVGILDFKARRKPTHSDFERREWLWMRWPAGDLERATYGVWPEGYRSVKSKFEIVGTTSIRRSDPRTGQSGTIWHVLCGDSTLLCLGKYNARKQPRSNHKRG